MGRPKLLLPWGDWTVIDQVLNAWTHSTVDHVVVVVRDDDEGLKSACGRWPVHLVKPLRPPRDMKDSVQIGLTFLEEHWQPSSEDQCFVAPADLPGLTSDVIDQLIEAAADASAVTIPQFGDRQGHPALLPWSVTQQIANLPDDQGIDRVVNQNPQRVVSFPAAGYFGDMDTPKDYRRMRGEQDWHPN